MESSRVSRKLEWTIIACIFVVSCIFLIIGFSLLSSVYTVTAGLVLLFIGGPMMIGTAFVVAKTHRRPWQNHGTRINHPSRDHPPSYRVSWTRAFVRRYQHVHNRPSPIEMSELTDTSFLASETQSTCSTPVPAGTTADDVRPSTPCQASRLSENFTIISEQCSSGYVEDELEGDLEDHLSGSNPRYAQSMATTLLDPPSYEAALANMEEDDLKKLEDQVRLPALDDKAEDNKSDT